MLSNWKQFAFPLSIGICPLRAGSRGEQLVLPFARLNSVQSHPCQSWAELKGLLALQKESFYYSRGREVTVDVLSPSDEKFSQSWGENTKVPRLAQGSVSNSPFYALICGGTSEYLHPQAGSKEGWHFSPQKSQVLFPMFRGKGKGEEQNLTPRPVPFSNRHIGGHSSVHRTSITPTPYCLGAPNA